MKIYKPDVIRVQRFNEENGFYTTSARSNLMAKIKGVETKPEIAFRKALWEKGLRYRKNVKSLPGKPDVVFRKYKIVIFIDGEFWHGYNWDTKKDKIKTNRGFWIPKIERNMQRDAENNALLELSGYKVYRFWEKEVKNNLPQIVDEILKAISGIELKSKS